MLKKYVIFILSIVIVLLSILLFYEVITKYSNNEMNKYEITYAYAVDWDNKIADQAVTVAYDDAIQIANVIYERMYGKEYLMNTDCSAYELINQTIDGKENIDVIIISRTEKGSATYGGNTDIAINKQNGQIIKIYLGF